MNFDGPYDDMLRKARTIGEDNHKATNKNNETLTSEPIVTKKMIDDKYRSNLIGTVKEFDPNGRTVTFVTGDGKESKHHIASPRHRGVMFRVDRVRKLNDALESVKNIVVPAKQDAYAGYKLDQDDFLSWPYSKSK